MAGLIAYALISVTSNHRLIGIESLWIVEWVMTSWCPPNWSCLRMVGAVMQVVFETNYHDQLQTAALC